MDRQLETPPTFPVNCGLLFRRCVLLTIVAAFFCIQATAATTAESFRYAGEKELADLSVGKEKEPGAYLIKAAAVVDAKIEVVLEVLKDVPSYPLWMENCSRIQLLEWRSDGDFSFYVEYEALWPIADRDAIMNITSINHLQCGKVEIFTRASQEPVVPRKKGYVRLTNIQETWLVEYMSRDRTKISITSRGNMAGGVPAFIARFFTKKILVNSLNNLRNLTKAERYRKAAQNSLYHLQVEQYLASRALKP